VCNVRGKKKMINRNIIYRNFLENEIKLLRYEQRLTIKEITDYLTTKKHIQISRETVRKYLKNNTQFHGITRENTANSQTK